MAGSPQYQNIIKQLFKLAYPTERLVTASVIKEKFPKLRVSNRKDWYDVAFTCISALRKDSSLISQTSLEKTEQLIASVETSTETKAITEPQIIEEDEEDDEEYYKKEIERKKKYTLFDKKLLAEEQAYGNDTAVELLRINNIFCGSFLKLEEIVSNKNNYGKSNHPTFYDRSCLKDYKISGKFTNVFGFLESELSEKDKKTGFDARHLHYECHNLFWQEYGKLEHWTDTNLKNIAVCKFELIIEDQKFYFSIDFWNNFTITALNRNNNKYESLFNVVNIYNFLDVLYETCTKSPEINEARKYRLIREALVAGSLVA